MVVVKIPRDLPEVLARTSLAEREGGQHSRAPLAEYHTFDVVTPPEVGREQGSKRPVPLMLRSGFPMLLVVLDRS